MITFFDLDSVCFNFNKAASIAHGREYVENTNFLLEREWGISSKDFWRPIDKLGSKFWADIDPYEWFHDLINLVSEEYYIATSPSHAASATEGKVQSIQKHFGLHFRNYFITPKKWLLGGIGRVLIDDLESNCKKFEEYGGNAILFPQTYNSHSHLVNDRIGFVKEELEKLEMINV